MAIDFEIRDLPLRLGEFLALTVAGQEIVLREGGVARARVLPCVSSSTVRTPGLHAGAIEVRTDFDEPLVDAFWLGQP